MKLVHATAQVAHLWANQVQSEAYNAGRTARFEGDTFYSYSTPIARLVPGADRALVALINPTSYSMTTSCRHMPAVHRAVRHLRSFTVPALGSYGGRHVEPAGKMHDANLIYFIEQYTDRVARMMRMQSEPYGDLTASLSAEWQDGPVAYAAAFGMKRKRLLTRDVPADVAAIVARFERLHAKRNKPGYQEALERQRAQRDARKEAKRQAALAERAKTDAEHRQAFRDGAPRSYNIGGPIMLRLNGDTFQTSQGADVPHAEGVAMLRYIAAQLADDNRRFPLCFGDAGPMAGGFTLREIARESVTIGCHVIPMSECAAMAALVGIEWPVQS